MKPRKIERPKGTPSTAPSKHEPLLAVLVMRVSTHHTHDPAQRHDPDIPPPLLPPDAPSTSSERISLTRECTGLVDEQVESFSSLKDRVDVLHHDVFPVIAVSLRCTRLAESCCLNEIF